MIQIIQIMHLANADFEHFLTFALAQDVTTLETLLEDWTVDVSSASISDTRFFLVLKAGKAIGGGSIIQSPDAPPKAGIALLKHCFIIPTEQNKGYGTQLFRHLKHFSQCHFDMLQLKKDCPLYQRTGGLTELIIK